MSLIATIGLPRAGLAVGLATVVVVGPLTWAFLHRRPPGAHARADVPSPRRLLVRQRGFLSLSIAFALGLFAQIGLFSHLIARLEPAFGATLAALAISLTTLCAVLGRTLLGWLIGEHDRRHAAAANFLMQAAGTLLLALGEGTATLATGCVLFGLGVGNLISLPPLIAQREFRPVDVATVVALVAAINQAVFALAPAIFGLARDLDGGYVSVFLAAAAVQIAAAVIVAGGRRFS
jgi:predicted MFS family arabinose efflux permease